MPYVSLASEIRVNGSEVHRDPSLAEPISRGWTRPRYFVLDSPLLRVGDNEATVRVSGLAAYQPGIREVKVGDPIALQTEYRREFLLRHDLRVVSHTVGIVLGALFGVLWLLRRRDAHYGWFALSEAFFVAYGWNYIAESPWPFVNTDTWAAANIAAYLCSDVCLSIFLLRYCNRRWPRTERLLLLLGGTALLLAAVAPGYLGPHRNPWALAGAALFYTATIAFILFAVRQGGRNHRLMAACFALQILVSAHDLAFPPGPQPAAIRVSIRDNGCGLSPDAAAGRVGTGLPSMRARALRLGSKLSITSSRGMAPASNSTSPFDPRLTATRIAGCPVPGAIPPISGMACIPGLANVRRAGRRMTPPWANDHSRNPGDRSTCLN